jgi:ADP-ribose pyrophosphatase
MNQEHRSQVLAEGRFVRLVRRDGWEWAERTNNSGVVAIVAITAEAEIVLTEQYRLPVGARVLEPPMGLSGDLDGAESEDLHEAARRELLEETGYAAARLEWLGEGPTSAGLTNEVVTFFLARGCRRVARGGGDESEDIEVHVVPLDQADAWLEGKRASGVLLDPKVFAALYFAKQHVSSAEQGTAEK